MKKVFPGALGEDDLKLSQVVECVTQCCSVFILRSTPVVSKRHFELPIKEMNDYFQ